MIRRETVPNTGASMYIAKKEEKNLQKKTKNRAVCAYFIHKETSPLPVKGFFVTTFNST